MIDRLPLWACAVALFLIGYLLGSVWFGRIQARRKGRD